MSSINPRLDRAINELRLLAEDTCPCKREVVLVEALHGYAESRGFRMEPASIEQDGCIPFSAFPHPGEEGGSQVVVDERLLCLERLLGKPDSNGRLPRTRVAAAALEKELRAAFSLPEHPLPAGSTTSA